METKAKTIYEDSEILVLNKPSGLVVNRSQTSPTNTLQDYLDSDFDYLDGVGGNGDPETEIFKERSGLAHRIDKDTSGIVVVVKTLEGFNSILKQFKDRSVKKEYLAVVWGEVEDAAFEIDAPIKRNPSNPMKFVVSPLGKKSLTRVKKAKVFEKGGHKFTLLRVYPETGRTHQIRVHMSATGHPVVGDAVYCTSKQMSSSQDLFSRMMLHAYRISFLHPAKNEVVEFECDPSSEFSLV